MASQTNSIEKVNATVQGTGVNREKSSEDYVPDIVVDDVSYSDNLFEDFSPTVAGESQDFESMIHCCDKLPYIDITGGIVTSNEIPTFPTYAACEDKYEYIHPCGCPQVFLWEYNRGGSLINAYKEAEGQSNYKANGTPDKHPFINSSSPATDSMFGSNGAIGFYSLGAQDDPNTATHFGKYALRCDNLHKGCSYVVYVVFTMQDDDTNGGALFHGGAESIPFTADNCVHYIGGDKEGDHVDDTNSELKKFPSAVGGDDGYVNIKGLHIQMNKVGRGRSQSDESHDENPATCE
jgi:hypothetical protein